MTKSHLINASVAALVSGFVFATNITPASACWGPNKEFGGADCGKGGGTDASGSASQPSQTSSSSSSSSAGADVRPPPRPERPDTRVGSNSAGGNSKGQGDWSGYGGDRTSSKDGDWSGRRPPRRADDRESGPRQAGDGCRYGCGDRPARRPRDDYGSRSDRGGPIYHPNRSPYADGDYGRRGRDDDYVGYGRRHDDMSYLRPAIRVILGGYGGYGR